MGNLNYLEYGWEGFVVALISCAVIELIKIPVGKAVQKKAKDAGRVFGALMLGISVVWGAAAAVIFSLAFHSFDIASAACWGFVLWVVSATQLIYAMYEKLGLRGTVKKLFSLASGKLSDKDGKTPAETAENTEDTKE